MSSVSITGGRSRSRAVKLLPLPVTLIFLLSPSTPAARPTALCDCRSLYCSSTSPDVASRKYWTMSTCAVTARMRHASRKAPSSRGSTTSSGSAAPSCAVPASAAIRARTSSGASPGSGEMSIPS